MSILSKQEVRKNSETSLDIVSDCLDVATGYRKKRMYNDAEIYFLKVTEQLEQLVRTEDSDENWISLIDTYGKLALMFDEVKDIERAKKYYLRAMDIMEDRVAENKLEYVSGLVACCNCLGVLIESIDCFRKAYTYAQLNPDDPICKDTIETWSDVF